MLNEKPAKSSAVDMDRMEMINELDEISIQDLLKRLWLRRAGIALWSLAIFVSVFFAGGLVFLLQERTESGMLCFRLDFSDVENGKYPSGLPFSTEDIISVPVLTRVYQNNGLQAYMEFPEFKAAMSIVQTNDRIRLLRYEYAAKLSDRKLKMAERQQLEKEYQEKKNAAMGPVYLLRFSYQSRFFRIPRELVAEVLNDTLSVWAEYAAQTKGAIQYEIALASSNLMEENSLSSEDYLVIIDMMLSTIKRVQNCIDEIKTIPGYELVRVGKRQISVMDIEYRLLDLVNIDLKPLNSLLCNEGISKNRNLALSFIKNEIFERSLQKQEAISQKKVYRESLKNYLLKGESVQANSGTETRISPMIGESSAGIPAMIPQFGADFLNSMIELGQERSDARFRQEVTELAIEAGIKEVEAESQISYYKSMLNAMGNDEDFSKIDSSMDEAARIKTESTLKKAHDEISNSIKVLNTVYQDLLIRYLEPQATLYSLLEPAIIKSTKAVSAKRILMAMVLAWFLLEAVVLIGYLGFTKDNQHIRSQVPPAKPEA